MLQRLDADLLLSRRCLFGGGTAISLRRGEYRESVDIDFICSSIDGYREMRQHVTHSGMSWAFTRPVTLVREPRVDQYGIRCALGVDDVPVKFEIVFEGRIALADPGPADRVCGVWTLAIDDMAATKLMANADRWADDSTMSRDLIDLAMLVDDGQLPSAGVAKARRAYGTSIDRSFATSRERLFDRPGRLHLCMARMGMTMADDDLRRRIEALTIEPTA